MEVRMADETKIEAQAAAEAPAKVAHAVADAAEKAVQASAKAAKITARKARNTRRAKPARKAAAPRIERTNTMTNDLNKLFAFDAVPGADKFQTLFADAGERSQEIARKSQKAAEGFAEIAKANIEALAEAGRIATSGVRTLGQDA